MSYETAWPRFVLLGLNVGDCLHLFRRGIFMQAVVYSVLAIFWFVSVFGVIEAFLPAIQELLRSHKITQRKLKLRALQAKR